VAFRAPLFPRVAVDWAEFGQSASSAFGSPFLHGD